MKLKNSFLVTSLASVILIFALFITGAADANSPKVYVCNNCSDAEMKYQASKSGLSNTKSYAHVFDLLNSVYRKYQVTRKIAEHEDATHTSFIAINVTVDASIQGAFTRYADATTALLEKLESKRFYVNDSEIMFVEHPPGGFSSYYSGVVHQNTSITTKSDPSKDCSIAPETDHHELTAHNFIQEPWRMSQLYNKLEALEEDSNGFNLLGWMEKRQQFLNMLASSGVKSFEIAESELSSATLSPGTIAVETPDSGRFVVKFDFKLRSGTLLGAVDGNCNPIPLANQSPKGDFKFTSLTGLNAMSNFLSGFHGIDVIEVSNDGRCTEWKMTCTGPKGADPTCKFLCVKTK